MSPTFGHVLVALIWAAFFVFLVLAYRKAVVGFLDARRARAEADAGEREVSLQERRQAVAVAEATRDEQALLRAAELRQRAAEADAAAEVARATTAARVEEEERVIAARAEGRALAAKDRAMATPEESGSFAAAMQAYARYRETGGSGTLDTWLGDRDIDEIK